MFLRLSLTLISVIAFFNFQSLNFVSASKLSCGVCEAIVDEIESGISSTIKQHYVQTRFRIDEKKKVPYSRTEHNLMEIIDAPGFARKFDLYGVVKPNSRSATLLKEAFMKVNNKDNTDNDDYIESNTSTVDATTPDVIDSTDSSTTNTPNPSDEVASATADVTGTSTPTSTSTPIVPEIKGTGGSFKAHGPLPLTLELNYPHLILMSHIKGSNLSADKTPETRAEISVEVTSFIEEHLDATLAVFHRDEPDLKRKLCGEITKSCEKIQKKKKSNKKSNPPADKEDL